MVGICSVLLDYSKRTFSKRIKSDWREEEVGKTRKSQEDKTMSFE